MKIFCIGRNYANHAKEMNAPVPDAPVVFMKPPTALLLKDRPFYYPEFSKNIHYECELVVKICKNGRSVQPEFASQYFKEVALGIDFTARDLQAQCKEKRHPWEIAKAFDRSAVLGSFTSIDQLDMDNLKFELKKGDSIVQTGHVNDMLFSIESIICYLSKFFTLQIGDLIYTGTPEGVGPVHIGDKLEGFLYTKEGSKRSFECEIR